MSLEVFILLVATASFAMVPTSSIMKKEQVEEATLKLLNNCKAEAKAGDTDIAMLKDRKIPETKEGLCMIACFFEKGSMMKDGQFDKDGMITTVTTHLGELGGKVKQVAETCHTSLGTLGGDKCENAKLIAECLHEHGKKLGVEQDIL